MRRVLGQPFVADFGKAELALDHFKGVLHIGPHIGLELLGLAQQGAQLRLLVWCPTFARAHRHLPGHARRFKSFTGPLVAGIGKHHGFLAVQQAVSLGGVVDVGRCADDV